MHQVECVFRKVKVEY